MPKMNNFNIKEDRVEEILRVKQNLGQMLDAPIKQPTGIAKTVQPDERLGLDEWFAYIKKSLREKDKFGNLDIK